MVKNRKKSKKTEKFYAQQPDESSNIRLLKGAPVEGACHVIGNPDDCEVITFHEAFIDAVVAFNAIPNACCVTVLSESGFDPVNKAFAARYPNTKRVNVANNESAYNAARKHNGYFVSPEVGM